MMGRRFALAVLASSGCVDPIERIEPSTASTKQASIACADGPTVAGIDVSYYEESIDWPTVRAAGVEFAIIRATDGTTYLDSKFPEYWAGAKSAGVIRGAYQFFRPAEDPIEQADLLLAQMGPPEPGDLPPTIDVEVSGGLDPASVTASVNLWIDHVTAAIGRPPIVYAGLYSWQDLTANADVTSSPLWMAQYTEAPCPDIPSPWTRWLIWQHSSTGSVAGIPGTALDVNVFNGSRDDLLAFTNGGSCADGDGSSCEPCGVIPAGGGEIDDGDACFVAAGPTAYLRHVDDAGEGGDLIWTHATDSAAQADFATWTIVVEQPGRYRVEAYTDGRYAEAHRAAYVIAAGGTTSTAHIDQAAHDGWQSLGEFDFAASGHQSVHLADNTGEDSSDNLQLVFDAIRLVPVDGSGPPAPTDTSGGGCSAGGQSSLVIALVAIGLPLRKRRRKARSSVRTH